MPNRIPAARANCPLTDLVDMIGGRWKVLALWRLREGTMRFGALRKSMPGVTQKMLTQQLRQLEEDGLISRKVFPQVPPRVDYALTAAGEELGDLLVTLSDWAALHLPSIQGKRASGKRPRRAVAV